MNDLVNITNKDGTLLVSSREVAKDFNKEHNDTKKRIRDLAQDMGEKSHIYFYENSYLDSMNRRQNEYLMTRDGFTLLAMGFNGTKAMSWKLKYIEAFNRMEEIIKTRSIPQGKELMALAVLEAQKTIDAQTSLLAEQKPKVVLADAITESITSISIGDLAKILRQNGVDTGQNKLFEWMRKNRYLIHRKGTDYNMPTQRSMNMRLFEIKEASFVRSDGLTAINKTPKVTGKGQNYFINKFLNEEVSKQNGTKSKTVNALPQN